MIFIDLIDFCGLIWSFDSPELCIKCLRMSFWNDLHVLTTCWMRVDLPHESLHNFCVFTSELFLTLVDIPWDFELLQAIHNFYVLYFLSCVTLPWCRFSRTCFDSHSRSHFAYALDNMIEAVFLWFIETHYQIATFVMYYISLASPFEPISIFLDLNLLL